eukprot:gene20956-21704_t
MVQFRKSRVVSTVLAAALAGCAFTASAFATDASRYAPAPPIVLSPDLAEPWIMQLRPPSYRDEVTYVPQVQPRRFMPPISLWQSARDAQAAPDSNRRIVRQANYAPPERTITEEFLPTEIDYHGPHKPGTIVIDTTERHLHHPRTSDWPGRCSALCVDIRHDGAAVEMPGGVAEHRQDHHQAEEHRQAGNSEHGGDEDAPADHRRRARRNDA